jgi:hypothetical protein
MGFMRIAWTGLLILVMAGCAVNEQTRQSLSGYAQAMAQVEQSADMFLTDFSDGLKVQAQLKRVGSVAAARVVPEYPTVLKLPDHQSEPRSEAEDEVQQTRQALAVVRAYNDALVGLAEGRPQSEIQQSLLSLGTELQTLASVAGLAIAPFAPFAAIGAKLVKLAQDAASRKQLEQAVLEGREPVRTILEVLEQQTPSMYRLSVVGTKQAQTDLRNEIRRTAFALKGLVARYGPPTDASVSSRVAADQTLLGEFGRKTDTVPAMPIPYLFAVGGPPYDAAADAQTQVFVHSISVSAQKYAELIAKQNAYHAMLLQYVALLNRTGEALDHLARSLTGPVDLRTEVFGLLRTAFDLRDAMAAYRHPPVTTNP